MVKTEANTIHPAAFVNQPVAAPHQPRFAQQLPPGGSQVALRASGSPSWRPLQTQKFLACTIQQGALLRELRVAKLATPTVDDPKP